MKLYFELVDIIFETYAIIFNHLFQDILLDVDALTMTGLHLFGNSFLIFHGN